MRKDETADLGLPRTLRSPWRWFTFVIGAVLVLVGVSGFAAGVEDSADLVIWLVFLAFGGVVIYLSWRAGVMVNERYFEERGMSGGSTRMEWADVDDVRIVEGPSVLPSKTVEVVGRNGVESITLASLSWYAFRARKVPSRAAEFKRIASRLMGS